VFFNPTEPRLPRKEDVSFPRGHAGHDGTGTHQEKAGALAWG